MFFDKKDFPWIEMFEDNWTDIRDELNALPKDLFTGWPEIRYYNQGWNTFGFYGWGVRLDKHCKMCPKTAALLDKVPKIFNAGFSMMNPKTHIRPHRGYPEGVLRLHVPLIVPGDCLFRVENETREWKEGECFVFDDTMKHEAWNNSDKVRTVMLVDFEAIDKVYKKPKEPKGILAKLLS